MTDKTPGKTRLQRATQYLDKKGRLDLFTGLIGARSLEATAQEQAKNQEAESKWARDKVWGSDNAQQPENEAMGDTILGDVTHPTPIVINGNNGGGSLGKTLATLAAGTLLGGTGVGGGIALAYQLLKDDPEPAPVVEPNDDETVSIGLGKIEDYLNK